MSISTSVHPRYRGEVIDSHCHFDRTTHDRALEALAAGGLVGALALWDIRWPPALPDEEAAIWHDLEPAVRRCHVPDLSTVGAPGAEADLATSLRAAAASGAIGVKVWKNLGLWLNDVHGRRVPVDDPRIAVVWETAAELELPIVIHVGDPPALFAPMDDDNPRIAELRIHPEWWYGRGGFPSLEQVHAEFERVVAEHRSTVFIGAHFGCFMDLPDVRRMLRAYPNYHVDTAAVIADLGAGDVRPVRQLITDHADRILFGTDLIRTSTYEMPDQGERRWDLAEFFDRHWRFFETADVGLPHPLPDQGAWTVTGLDLPDPVLERVYSRNARTLFRWPAARLAARLV